MNRQIIILRVQDKEGRGPFRPGMTQHWKDADYSSRVIPPTWDVEFGKFLLHGEPGTHSYGCGLRSREQLRRWFSATEEPRLHELNYRLVSLKVDRILAESENQLIFAPEAVAQTRNYRILGLER
jgi:hypothetical protein